MSRALAIVLFAIVTTASALRCLQTQADGTVKEESRAEWRYCSLMPLGNGALHLDAMTEKTDDLRSLDSLFDVSVKGYNVGFVCFAETLSFGHLGGRFEGKVEQNTRCACNTNSCNTHQALDDFKKTLM